MFFYLRGRPQLVTVNSKMMKIFLLVLFCFVMNYMVACQIGERPAEDLYKVLGISRGASKEEIQREFRRLAKIHHPDKSGDEVLFRKIKQAHEVLVDPIMRKFYDDTGRIASTQEISSQRSGGMPSQFKRQQRSDLVLPLFLSLDEMYNGAYLEIAVRKQAVCDQCSGTGARGGSAGMQKCPDCGGQGHRVAHQMVAPGMYMQTQKQCDRCQGRGQQVLHKCPNCDGKKVKPRSERAFITIRAGQAIGDRITVPDAGDSGPDYDSRNIVFEIHEQPSNESGTFRREGLNLHTHIVVGLYDALSGFKKTIRHLDGRNITIKRVGVTQSGHVDVILREGMPNPGFQSDINDRGNLYVQFAVVLPPGPFKSETIETIAKSLGNLKEQ